MFGLFIGFMSLAGLLVVLGQERRAWRHRTPRERHWYAPVSVAGWGRHRSRLLRALYRRLDTTTGQEKEIAAAMQIVEDQARRVRDDARSTRSDLAGLLLTESLDEETLAGVLTRHEERLGEVQRAFADAFARIHIALDPEQRATLAGMLDGRAASRAGGPYRSCA